MRGAKNTYVKSASTNKGEIREKNRRETKKGLMLV